jgi:hypothetical protein
MARVILMLVEIKELCISAVFGRPHSFLVLVSVLVKALGGVAVYLLVVGAGAMALVWYMGRVAVAAL